MIKLKISCSLTILIPVLELGEGMTRPENFVFGVHLALYFILRKSPNLFDLLSG